MTTVYLVEDEPLALAALVQIFRAVPGWHVLGSASDGQSALDACRLAPPDVLVTDVRMPKLDGMALAEALRASFPTMQIVFITAHEEHAVQAFRVAAVDYLLKPVTDAQLRACVARVEPLLKQQVRQLVIRSVGRVDLVPLDDVIALRAEGNYVSVVTAEKTWLHRETMKSLSSRLDPSAFTQIHRSTIVAVAHVRRIENGKVVMSNGAVYRATSLPLRTA